MNTFASKSDRGQVLGGLSLDFRWALPMTVIGIAVLSASNSFAHTQSTSSWPPTPSGAELKRHASLLAGLPAPKGAQIKRMSKRPVSLAARLPASNGAPTQRTSIRSWNPLPEERLAPIREFLERLGRDLDVARNHFRAFRYNEARVICESVFLEFPQSSMAVPLLTDIYMRQNRYQEARALIMPFVRPGADDHILIRASLVLSQLGEVHPGQAQYLRDVILFNWTDFSGIPEALPTGESLHAVRLLSALAAGHFGDMTGQDEDALYYLGRALQLHPTNAFARFVIGEIQLRNRQYASAKTHLQIAHVYAIGRLKEFAWRRYNQALAAGR